MAGWGKRQNPYYSNQRFQYGSNYNFSSDVNLSNSGGSFQYGPAPQYGRPYGRGGGRRGNGGGFRGRGGGGGYMGRGGGGWGGGYNPQPFVYNQRGYGNQQFYRGNYPRRGPPGGGTGYRGNYRGGGQNYGGSYQQGYQQGPYQNRKFYGGGGDPFYSPTMFEDPWRFLLPKPPEEKQEEAKPKVAETTIEVATKENNEGEAAESMEVTDGNEQNRTDSANGTSAMESEMGSHSEAVQESSAALQERKSSEEIEPLAPDNTTEGTGVSTGDVSNDHEGRSMDGQVTLEGESEVSREHDATSGESGPVAEEENESASVAKEIEEDLPVVEENKIETETAATSE